MFTSAGSVSGGLPALCWECFLIYTPSLLAVAETVHPQVHFLHFFAKIATFCRTKAAQGLLNSGQCDEPKR